MPILDPHTLEFFSRSADQTRRLGMRLGPLMQRGDVVLLLGDLGSGKTTFVQGLAQGFGSLDAVSSPTFVIMNVYRRLDGVNLIHMDAYRLMSAIEAEEMDLDLFLENGVLAVEWPEKIMSALPKDYLEIKMRWLDDEQRGLIFYPYGSRYKAMLEEYRRRVVGG